MGLLVPKKCIGLQPVGNNGELHQLLQMAQHHSQLHFLQMFIRFWLHRVVTITMLANIQNVLNLQVNHHLLGYGVNYTSMVAFYTSLHSESDYLP